MQPEVQIPLLLSLLLGDAADIALGAASPRLLRWCQAYEDWLAEQRLKNRSAAEHAHWAWRTFLGQVHHMPWQITQDDVESYVAWMRSQDYAPGSIAVQLRRLAHFYRWCSARHIDPECPPGFNPAAQVKRPGDPHYRSRKLLSLEEVRRLLAFMQRDTSPLGRRDFAFVLARLRLGAPQAGLQKLRWGQIEQDGAFVRWRPDSQPCPLAEDAYEAIRLALQAGGRLPPPNPLDKASDSLSPGEDQHSLSTKVERVRVRPVVRAGVGYICPADYVFAPLADPLALDRGTLAQDWRADKYMDRHTLRDTLNRYGRAAGLPPEKLNPQTLRLTAIRIHLDECAGLDEPTMLAKMMIFMDSRLDVYHLKHRLSKLPPLPTVSGPWQPQDEAEIPLPGHVRHIYTREESTIHGFYAGSQPPQAIAEMLAQDVRGIDAEFEGLRILGRGLIARQEQSASSQEIAILVQAYTLYTYRLAQLSKAEPELLGKDELDQPTREFLERMDKWTIENGQPAFSELLQRELDGTDPGLPAASRHLVEEVAGLRCVIRRTFDLALAAGDAHAYATLVDVYGRACVRLVKLLKSQGSSAGRMQALINETFNTALYEVSLELGLLPDES